MREDIPLYHFSVTDKVVKEVEREVVKEVVKDVLVVHILEHCTLNSINSHITIYLKHF